MARISLQAACDHARQALETNNPEQAIAIAEHIQTEWPEALEVYRILGEAYLANRQLDQAEAAFSRVLAADPENIPAHVGLGITYERQGRLDRAVPEFEQALEVKPDVPELRSQLLRLYTEAWGSENAQLRLSRAGLARLYARGHMYDQAIAEFQSVVADDPTRLDARVALAETLWREGRNEEAADACRQILANGDVLKAHLLLGYLGLTADTPEGQQSWNRAYQMDPYQTVARQLFEQLRDTTTPEPTVEEWDERAWEQRRVDAEVAATRAIEQPAAVAAVAPIAPAITTPLPELTTPDEPEPTPAEQPEPVLMGEPSSAGWFDTLDSPPASSGVTADYDDFLAGLLASSGFAAPSAPAASASAASAASYDLDGDLPHFSIDDLDEGPTPTGTPSLSAQNAQPFSLTDLGISDEEFESFGGTPVTPPATPIPATEPAASTEPATPAADDPDLSPFSLADLGLSDDEIAELEANEAPLAAEEPSAAVEAPPVPTVPAEQPLTPFSLADLGLSDEEIASLDSAAGVAEQDAAPTAPAASADEPQMTPFSLADLGLSDEEIASLNATSSADTPVAEPPAAAPAVSDEPAVKPFSFADLGLDDDDLASLDSAIGGPTTATPAPQASAAPLDDDLGFSPFSLDDLDLDEPTASAPQSGSDDLPAELRPFSLDELDFDEPGTAAQSGLPQSLEPFSLDERQPPPRGNQASFNPQEPNDEEPQQGGYSWQQPSQRLRPSFLDSVARVGEGEENSIFGKLKQRRQSGMLGPIPGEESAEPAAEAPEDARLFSDDNVSLRDDTPATPGTGSLEEGFASGEIQPFSLGDLGLNEDEIAALGLGTATAAAGAAASAPTAASSKEPAPFDFEDIDTPAPTASATPAEPAPFDFADFDTPAAATPTASAEPAPFDFADFDTPTAAAPATPTEPAPFDFNSLDEPATAAPSAALDFEKPAIDLTNDAIESESVSEALASGEIKPFSFADLGLSEEEARALGMLPEETATTAQPEVPAPIAWDEPTAPVAEPAAPVAEQPSPAAEPPAKPAIDLTNDAIESESVSEALASGEIKPFSFADLGLSEDEARALGMLPDAPVPADAPAAAPDTGGDEGVQPFSMSDLGFSDDDISSLGLNTPDTGAPRLGLTTEDLDALDMDGLNWDLPPVEPPAAPPQPAATELVTSGDLMLDRLMALGREQGFVDIADIMAGIEDPEAEADRIEEIGRRLHEANIQIRDGNEIIDMDADYTEEDDLFAAETPPADTTSATAAFALSDLGLSEEDLRPAAPATNADDDFAFGDLSLLDELDAQEAAAAAQPVAEPAPPAAQVPPPAVAPVPPVAQVPPPAAEPVASVPPPAAVPAPPAAPPSGATSAAVPAGVSGAWATRLSGFEEQLSANPGNHPLRLSLARFTAQASQVDAAVKHYKQLVRQGVLLDDVTADLQDLIEDETETETLRKLHRLLGDTYARQGLVDDAMREYNWTVS